MKNQIKFNHISKILYPTLLLLFTVQLFSQDQKIDSLKKVILHSKTDTVIINSLIELSWEYCYGGMYDSTIKYCNQTLLATKKNTKATANWNSKKTAEVQRIIGTTNLMKGDYDKAVSCFRKSHEISNGINDKRGMAKTLMNIGSVYLYKSEFDSSLFYYNKSLTLEQLLKNDHGISDVYICVGAIYFNQGNYPRSLNSFYSALKIKEKIKEDNGISSCLNNIASIYILQKKYNLALELFQKSLDISEKIMDKQGIVNSYSNIGVVYLKTGNYVKALESHFKTLKLYEEMEYMLGYSTALLNIGLTYNNLNKTPEAIEYLLKAVKVKKEIDDLSGLAQCYINLGSIYTDLKNFNEAKKYLYEAQTITENLGDLEKLQDLYFSLSVLEEKTKNFERSLNYFQKYLTFRDSLNAEENVKISLQTSMQYEFDKKAAADSVKVAEERKVFDIQIKQERTQRFALYGGLILVLVFSGFMFNRFKVTKKQKQIIEEKEKETQNQNDIITLQKHLVEEKHKEITDSINYAERIQRSFLATKELLNENLPEYFILFKPKDVVSGDFYWGSKIINPDGVENFAFATADSTGHGVPGAIMSLLNITSLEKAIESNFDSAEILNHTRQTIIKRLEKDGSIEGGKDGMDCSLLMIDFKNKKLNMAAANNPIWIVREKELIEIKGDKMPVGKNDKQNTPFTSHNLELQSGDIIYTLTDGFPDQFGGPKGKKFMIKNLKELLVNNSSLPLSEQKELLEFTFKNWLGDLEQIDDVCVVGIKV